MIPLKKEKREMKLIVLQIKTLNDADWIIKITKTLIIDSIDGLIPDEVD